MSGPCTFSKPGMSGPCAVSWATIAPSMGRPRATGPTGVSPRMKAAGRRRKMTRCSAACLLHRGRTDQRPCDEAPAGAVQG
ncbi:hypothetical protein GLA29479_2506 [Lysobacter antibioticus]|nr:hypothetical protein GLA29479_2506 [Lysobacter antibioticus]